MRHTSRRLLEGQQPRLCRKCLGQTGDVNELKSRKINIKLNSSERNNTRESSCSRSVKAFHLNQINQIANHLYM